MTLQSLCTVVCIDDVTFVCIDKCVTSSVQCLQFACVLRSFSLLMFTDYLLPLLNPLRYRGRSNGKRCARLVFGAIVLWLSCVMRPVINCRTCSDALNIRFSPIQQKPIQFDTIHIVSVPIRYRPDNCPFSSAMYIYAWRPGSQRRRSSCKQ